jgi:hypothetical protein
MVWNSNTGGGAGHTGVVVSANVNTFDCYQQNDPYNSGMHVKTYNYANVIGWAIPKGGQLNPQGGQVMNREAGYELYRTGLHREPENAGVADQWNGLSPAEALKRLRAGDEWKYTNDFTKNYPNIAAENVKLKTDISGLQNENTNLKKRIEELEKMVIELQKQLEQQNQDSENLNKLGEILKWFIDRLGLNKGEKK